MNKLLVAAAVAASLALGNSAVAFDFWDDDDDWGKPPWVDDNDWPEFTPMYWMEEFADEMDDDDDDWYRYGPRGYGYNPYYGGGYGYPGYGGYGGYGYAPRGYGYGYPYGGYGYGYPQQQQQYQYPQQAPVQPQAPAAPQQ